MPVPELYGVIGSQSGVRRFMDIVEDRESFVIKPARGSGGDGIVVIVGRSKRKTASFRTASGLLIHAAELEHHISNIVGGQYSLSGHPDPALIEYCVQFDPLFADVSYQGVPDADAHSTRSRSFWVTSTSYGSTSSSSHWFMRASSTSNGSAPAPSS